MSETNNTADGNKEKPQGPYEHIFKDLLEHLSIYWKIIGLLLGFIITYIIVQMILMGNFIGEQKERMSEEMEQNRETMQLFTKNQREQITQELKSIRTELKNFTDDQKKQMMQKQEKNHAELDSFIKAEERQIAEKLEDSRRELEDFKNQYKQDIIESTVALLYSYYSETVERYTQKLTGSDSGQKDIAVWGLLNILNEIEARKEDHPNLYPGLFDKIVAEYAGAISYLRLDITEENFKDRYRGKVWIWAILLKSKNEYIKNVVCDEFKNEPGLTPELLYGLVKLVEEEHRSEFERSIDELTDLLNLCNE